MNIKMIYTFCSIHVYKNQEENLDTKIVLKIKFICLVIKTKIMCDQQDYKNQMINGIMVCAIHLIIAGV